MIFELRQALISYQDYHMLLLILSGLNVSPKAAIPATGSWTLAFNVSNTGSRDGATPVQVFFRDPCAFPVRLGSVQLARFTKIWLRAGPVPP